MVDTAKSKGASAETLTHVLNAIDWVATNLPSLHVEEEIAIVVELYTLKLLSEESVVKYKKSEFELKGMLSEGTEMINDQSLLIEEMGKLLEQKDKTISALKFALLDKDKSIQN